MISLLMMDIKGMKRFNDYFGHSFGDRILQSAAAALRRTVPARCPVFRYGGEEFVAFLLDTDKEEAIAAAERCQQAVAAIMLPPRPDKINNPMAIWIGIATETYPQELQPMVMYADIAMQAVQNLGRYENFSSSILHSDDVPAER